ncbi:glycosyltransferase [Pseudomonadota bacterium]
MVERHYEDYLSTKWHGFGLRVIRRLVLPLIKRNYNQAVAELLSVQGLDFLLVFKGMMLDADTLRKFKKRGVPCYLVYPDVSFKDHGKNIWECLPLYDAVFTTKSYHLDDKVVKGRARNLQFINHGYDPEVHRPIRPSASLLSTYGCDVSFVGCWSLKKEHTILAIIDSLPEVDFKLWGPNWGRASRQVREKWAGRGAYGDELAAIYSFSKINLGLLSEAGSGGLTGDQTTARSWQIPASGGFLLHEDTVEIRKYFEVDREIVVFSDVPDLVAKIAALLKDGALREQISRAGQKRCVNAPYTYAPAVKTVLDYHQNAIEATHIAPASL